MHQRFGAVIAIATFLNSCSPAPTSGGFPGLSIEAGCLQGSTVARYSEVDDMTPGEHSTGDSLEWRRFLSTVGELPLPCVDPKGESYRFIDWGSTFGATRIVGVTLRSQSRSEE